ncbi:hypothetical protein [Tenacibaculum aiptasiae]|uniref:hypothetical protein n=1 Tax=Tenacibaculum aiptasiae TaxID=426481 RepID=UPI00232D115B|nr:hypothetical protein [Tenacibaculum aiptasiae]
MKKLILLTLFIMFSSCEKNDKVIIDSDNLLLGSWTNAVNNPDIETTTFERVNKLPQEKDGVSFQKDGTFIKRTSGWCGTPPLIFNNIEGNFILNNDIIKVTFQEVQANFNWKIISLDEKKLVIKRTLTDQEKDHQKLMLLFSEIKNLVSSVSCTNKDKWSFTGYGSKACGGVQGYIAYSKEINVSAFLQKVKVYNQQEDEYNKKWGIISDCSFPAVPVGVDCVNGAPVFKY